MKYITFIFSSKESSTIYFNQGRILWSQKKLKSKVTNGFTRRDFLKAGAAGAAGLGLSSWVFTPFTYGAEKPIKIGMIQEHDGRGHRIRLLDGQGG